jgi:hypothetical protein
VNGYLFQNPLPTSFWPFLPKVLSEVSLVPPRTGSKMAKQTKEQGFETASKSVVIGSVAKTRRFGSP